MYKSKRDVDRHVAELEAQMPAGVERNLKSFTIAKLYFNVGEKEAALKHLDKYCEVRSNSAPAYKLRGQILESLSDSGPVERSGRLKAQAAEAYKAAYEVDLSQRELLIKICDLTSQLPVCDMDRASYWLEVSEKAFPKNNAVLRLKQRLKATNGSMDGGANGNNGVSSDASPNSQTTSGKENDDNDVEADNSVLWSTSRLASNFHLNGSYRVEDIMGGGGGGSSSTPAGASSARRFPPRPSPERLANQIKSLEANQEKAAAATAENSRLALEMGEAMLSELRKIRQTLGNEMRENTDSIRDIRAEMNAMRTEIKDKLREIATKKQEVVVLNNNNGGDNNSSQAPKPLAMADLQEALTQQATLIQMSHLGIASMLAPRPPVPQQAFLPQQLLAQHLLPQQQLPQHMLPQQPLPQLNPIPPMTQAQQQPLPAAASLQQTHHQQSSSTTTAKAAESKLTPKNVVITTSDKIPSVSAAPAIAPVNIPAQHLLAGHSKATDAAAAKPSPAKVEASTPAKPAEAANLFDSFKPKAGSWECNGCFIRNNADVIQCPACQNVQPGREAEVKAKEEAKPKITFGAKGGFTFGMQAGSSNAAAGAPTTAAAASPSSSGFSFGSPAAGKAASTTTTSGFSFGSPAVSKAAASTPASSAATESKPSPFANFSFGTAGSGNLNETAASTGSGFAFSTTITPQKSADKSMEKRDEQEENADDSANHDPHFEPIIPLPELVQVKTGEEDEEVRFQHRSKVFRFDKDTKEWKERGIGDLKILYHPQRKTFRVLLRREQVHKIACNHYITVDMKLEPMAKSETAVTWFAMDCSDDNEAKMEMLAAKFKLAETKDDFKKAFEEAQAELESQPEAESSADHGSELSFEGQGLKLNTASDAADVGAKIGAFKNMRTLTFSGNTVGIEAAEVIGKALEAHPEFENAHWKDMFTGRMKTEIPPALKHLSRGVMAANARLVELDLSDNAFGPIGMEGVVDLLKSPSCFTLRELKLNNTGCGVTGGKLLAKTLMEAYRLSEGKLALRVFVLGRSRQENEGAKALAEVFKAMGSLEEVVMPQNGIYHEGLSALADAFASNPNLRILNMNDNTFTEKGARAMANALAKMQKLAVLNLGDCLLKTEGARLIAYALKDGHPDLKHWHMDSNEIRLAGGLAIVDALKNKAKLESVAIDTNQFGADGCRRILQKLTDIGKRGVMEDIDEDEEPDDDDEDENDNAQANGESAVQNLSSFSFGASKGPSEIFGGKPAADSTTPDTKSIFNGVATPTGSSVFGGGSTAPSIFGSASSPASGVFGGFGKPAAPGASVFGTSTPASGIFGAASEQPTSIFGSKPESAASAGVDLSAKKELPSFSSLGGATTEFAFGKKTEGFSFQGTGASVFGKTNKSPAKAAADGEEGEEGEDGEHDPHFEPIIPLPELIQVKTGEEDEEVLFKHRSKVFRFDKDAKQWKERGVGDLKILYHPERSTYRVLLRRDQVHKIACNHYITTDMKLEPMSSSETAVTWIAMDYSEEGEGNMEMLAAKFKLAETKDDFKKVFEAAQEKIRSKPAEGVSTTTIVDKARLATDQDEDDGEHDDANDGGDGEDCGH